MEALCRVDNKPLSEYNQVKHMLGDLRRIMYTYDGLWYNLYFFDIVMLIAGINCILFGALDLRSKNDKEVKEAKWMLVGGIVCLLLVIPMFLSDLNSIRQENFHTTTGTFKYYHRAHRRAPFTGEYTFATEDSDLLIDLYLDASTLRKHLGPGYELTPGAEYEITYDESSDVLIGLKEISD